MRNYYGPCPYTSTNTYAFEVYALDLPVLDLGAVMSKPDLIAVIRDHILAWGELKGKFSPPADRLMISFFTLSPKPRY